MADSISRAHSRSVAAEQIPKKVLARRCKVNRPTFSYFLHGDKEMPERSKPS